MNEVQLRERMKGLSKAIGVNPNNYSMSNKLVWFSALIEAHKAKGKSIPSSLVALTRKYGYGQVDAELDAAIKAIEDQKEKEAKSGGTTKGSKAGSDQSTRKSA